MVGIFRVPIKCVLLLTVFKIKHLFTSWEGLLVNKSHEGDLPVDKFSIFINVIGSGGDNLLIGPPLSLASRIFLAEQDRQSKMTLLRAVPTFTSLEPTEALLLH